jgi:hypothetical protein
VKHALYFHDVCADEFVEVAPHTLTRATPEQLRTLARLRSFPLDCPDATVAAALSLRLVLESGGGAHAVLPGRTAVHQWSLTFLLECGEWTVVEEVDGECVPPPNDVAPRFANLEQAFGYVLLPDPEAAEALRQAGGLRRLWQT